MFLVFRNYLFNIGKIINVYKVWNLHNKTVSPLTNLSQLYDFSVLRSPESHIRKMSLYLNNKTKENSLRACTM